MNYGDRLFKVKEIAARLGVAENTVRIWLREGKIAYIQLNSKNFRIRESDFNKFLESRTTPTKWT